MLVLATLWSSSPALSQPARPWQIRDFEVVNVEPSGATEGNQNIDVWVEEMVRLIRATDTVDPDFPSLSRTVPLSSDTKADLEGVLRLAAEKLQEWGFPPPNLEPVVEGATGADAYRIYLVSNRPISGKYHAQRCSRGFREPVIVIDADEALELEELSNAGANTAVHELVHAVLANLPSYSCDDAEPGQWIGEGIADAIGWDVTREYRGLWTFANDPNETWGVRPYSNRLPVPGATGSPRAYATLSFWRFLAEHRQTRPDPPGPGVVWPVDYGYVPKLLGRAHTNRDCFRDGDLCKQELRWIDAGLRDVFDLPLRDLYARFLRDYARYGDHRVRDVLGGGDPTILRKDWLASSFFVGDESGCPKVTLSADVESRQKVSVVPRFPDHAAKCWEIELDGFSENVVLSVTADGPATAAQLSQLTAIMADESKRLDRAQVESRSSLELARATWYYDHLALAEEDRGGPAIFLLSNIADQPATTRPLPDLRVTFTALDPGASVSVSGGSGGEKKDGDSSPTISGALEYVVPSDRLRFGIQFVRRDLRACSITFNLPSEEGDLVQFGGQLPMPLAPVNVAVQPSYTMSAESVPALAANVSLGCDKGRCSEWGDNAIDGAAYQGWMEIEHVTTRQVIGRFDISAVNEPIRVVGEFVAPLGGPRGLPPGHPCAPDPRARP